MTITQSFVITNTQNIKNQMNISINNLHKLKINSPIDELHKQKWIVDTWSISFGLNKTNFKGFVCDFGVFTAKSKPICCLGNEIVNVDIFGTMTTFFESVKQNYQL